MIEPWTIIAILMLVTGGVEGGMKDTRARPFVLAIRQKITTIKNNVLYTDSTDKINYIPRSLVYILQGSVYS